MAKIYVFLADGCEEVEALTPVDLLRRAGHEVCTVSVMGRERIRGSHNIEITADAKIENTEAEDGDLLLLPGGMPGTRYLGECGKLREMLLDQNRKGKRIAAICAAPSVLGKLGLLKGKRAVCYPGFEEQLEGAEVLKIPAVTDGNITTARGVGAAIDFGLDLVKLLNGEKAAEELARQIVYTGGAEGLL